ncbi:hypothetical protein J3E71DRAFT_361890 [Bipolaris maydis]|nr:hypothetical protein J3E71DRAFT_361890 [Bipolaris maydis]
MPLRMERPNSTASKEDGSINKTSKNESRNGCGRRAQNRIARQYLRERRAASSRHADRISDTMQIIAEPERLTMLLEAQAKLTKENQRMEDALFRMRKKLLSLSNAAATAADDPIFDEFLGRKSSSSNCSLGELQEAMPTTTRESLRQDQICSALPSQETQSLESGHVQAFLEASSIAKEQGPNFFNALEDSQQTSAYNSKTTPLPACASPWDICSFAPLEKITICSAIDFSTKMLQAALNCRAGIRDTVTVAHLNTDQITQLVSVATVNLFSTCAGMQPYLYGVNAAAYMKKVVHLRLTKADRSLVLQPFRPTPLQSHFSESTLCPVVDFQPSPEIRDQFLLIGDKIDANAFSRDLVLNTVVEVPDRNVAVPIWGQFQQLHEGSQCNMFTTDAQVPRSTNDKGWVFCEINRVNRDFQFWAADPVEEALSRQLLRRIQEWSTGNGLSYTRIESPLVALDSRFRPEKTDLAQRLAAAGEWKLSKEFKAKYLQFDYSSGK